MFCVGRSVRIGVFGYREFLSARGKSMSTALAEKAAVSSLAKQINTSGIVPYEYKVLVKVKPSNKNANGEEVTKGGIVIAKQTTEREEMAKIEAVLIDFGGNAFEDWKGKIPKPGDVVIMAKYAGMMCEGNDGEEYRLINDKDIAAMRLDNE